MQNNYVNILVVKIVARCDFCDKQLFPITVTYCRRILSFISKDEVQYLPSGRRNNYKHLDG